jgi:hypothetical protein
MTPTSPIPRVFSLKRKREGRREPGMVVHDCNPSMERLRQEDHKFDIRLDYMVKPCLTKQRKKKKKERKQKK